MQTKTFKYLQADTKVFLTNGTLKKVSDLISKDTLLAYGGGDCTIRSIEQLDDKTVYSVHDMSSDNKTVYSVGEDHILTLTYVDETVVDTLMTLNCNIQYNEYDSSIIHMSVSDYNSLPTCIQTQLFAFRSEFELEFELEFESEFKSKELQSELNIDYYLLGYLVAEKHYKSNSSTVVVDKLSVINCFEDSVKNGWLTRELVNGKFVYIITDKINEFMLTHSYNNIIKSTSKNRFRYMCGFIEGCEKAQDDPSSIVITNDKVLATNISDIIKSLGYGTVEKQVATWINGVKTVVTPIVNSNFMYNDVFKDLQYDQYGTAYPITVTKNTVNNKIVKLKVMGADLIVVEDYHVV